MRLILLLATTAICLGLVVAAKQFYPSEFTLYIERANYESNVHRCDDIPKETAVALSGDFCQDHWNRKDLPRGDNPDWVRWVQEGPLSWMGLAAVLLLMWSVVATVVWREERTRPVPVQTKRPEPSAEDS